MVPGFFSFALNTVFFQNCIQNHSIVTTISTICFLYTLYPCMFFPARYNSQIPYISHQPFQTISRLLHICQAVIRIETCPFLFYRFCILYFALQTGCPM